MKDLTTEQKETLLEEVKSFLDITWEDERTDKDVWRFILNTINYLDDIAGVELDYLVDEGTEGDDLYISMCHLAKDLLCSRVYYEREKSADDFPHNFLTEINKLYLKGCAYASTQEDKN